MLMTGLAVITAPLWLPLYAIGVTATASAYVVGTATIIAIVL